MGRWQNFAIWRGRLPHWRADGVTYYVCFRHRRELDQFERRVLFLNLLRGDGRKWSLLILCVLPQQTEMILELLESPGGAIPELSEVVEKAKGKASKLIIKKSGERFGPFYFESYDRILRDEGEVAEFWDSILDSPVREGLAQEPEGWEELFVANQPSSP